MDGSTEMPAQCVSRSTVPSRSWRKKGCRRGRNKARSSNHRVIEVRGKKMKPRSSAASMASRIGKIVLVAIYCSLLNLLCAIPARAHEDGRPIALREVTFEQKLGEQAPLDAEFRDETGKTVRLGDYFAGRPVIMTFAYYRCQDICPLLLDGVTRALRALSFSAGREFTVVNVSFDSRETPWLAAAKKSDLLQRYARPGAADGWHFLTGDEASIQRLTAAAGFRYNYESDRDRFGHATGIMLLTPQGRFARYFYGIEFSPRDVRLGLVEASNGK